jgi:hypothetical protein
VQEHQAPDRHAPTDLFRNELFRARTPAKKGVLTELVDDVFLPLVRP